MDVWSGMEGVVWPAFVLHDEQLQLASSGNQFSRIWPHLILWRSCLLHVDACLEHQNSAVSECGVDRNEQVYTEISFFKMNKT